MAQTIEQRQEAAVAHRLNFWARPSGHHTVSWQYKAQAWVVKRPDDGSPAFRRTVRCEVCKKALNYAVHSVAATRRRRARRLFGAYAGLAALLGSVIGFVLMDDPGTTWIVLNVSALLLGSVLGWVCGLAAAEESGVSGHGAGWPGATLHTVILAEPVRGDLPALVCPRCGHQEAFPQGAHYREAFVQKRYRAAQARLENHECGSP